jgi:hypothetical protein
MKPPTCGALLLLALATAACGRTDRQEDPARSAAPADSPGMGAMPGMQGMGGMQSGGMVEQMRSHMAAMHGAGGDSLRAMLPMHRQMAGNLLAQMNREMREMNMAADAAWTATVDSLRQDLVRMPEMGAEELRSFMPAHEGRLERLMQMHGSMMGGMKM